MQQLTNLKLQHAKALIKAGFTTLVHIAKQGEEKAVERALRSVISPNASDIIVRKQARECRWHFGFARGSLPAMATKGPYY